MAKWGCSKCGECCKHWSVGIVMPEFWDSEKKQCKHLSGENLCKIYSERPDVCMVQEGVDCSFECEIIKMSNRIDKLLEKV